MTSLKPSSNACFSLVHTKIEDVRNQPRLELKEPFMGGGGVVLSSRSFFANQIPCLGQGKAHSWLKQLSGHLHFPNFQSLSNGFFFFALFCFVLFYVEYQARSSST